MSEAVAPDSQSLVDVRKLLDRLIPPDDLEIEDVFGNTYTVRTALSARAQVRMIRHIEALIGRASPSMGGMTLAGGNEGMQAIGLVLVKLAADEDVLNDLCSAFEVAHAAVVVKAGKAAKSEGFTKAAQADVAELFAIEEIIGGLIPFFVRLARKLIGSIEAVIPTVAEA